MKGFRAVPVFDVSQTEGKPLPEIVNPLVGDVQAYNEMFETLKAVSPFPVEIAPIKGADGYCRFGDDAKIVVRSGLSEQATIATLVHEIAHARLHVDKAGTRHQKELEAESVAYVVCQKYGIDTGENSFGYLAGWGEGDIAKLQSMLEVVSQASVSFINDIDSQMQKHLTSEKQEMLSLNNHQDLDKVDNQLKTTDVDVLNQIASAASLAEKMEIAKSHVATQDEREGHLGGERLV